MMQTKLRRVGFHHFHCLEEKIRWKFKPNSPRFYFGKWLPIFLPSSFFLFQMNQIQPKASGSLFPLSPSVVTRVLEKKSFCCFKISFQILLDKRAKEKKRQHWWTKVHQYPSFSAFLDLPWEWKISFILGRISFWLKF